MSGPATASGDPPIASRADAAPPTWRDYFDLTKPRIAGLVLVTAAAGFVLGSPGAPDWLELLHTLAGIALVAAGTGAMNQVLERDVDKRMVRTRGRPLPAGRLSVRPAIVFSALLTAAGVAYLGLLVNVLTAVLAAATFVSYDFVYTPLKRVHSFSTVVGAVPGALPALGGWTAATGRLDTGGWALFGILFLWQMPHFFALAWLLRDDYGAAGLRMLSVDDEGGVKTRRQTLLYTVALLPMSLVPAGLGLAGPIYVGAASILGLGFLWSAIQFGREASSDHARRLFRASILYLPVLLVALVLDRV